MALPPAYCVPPPPCVPTVYLPPYPLPPCTPAAYPVYYPAPPPPPPPQTVVVYPPPSCTPYPPCTPIFPPPCTPCYPPPSCKSACEPCCCKSACGPSSCCNPCRSSCCRPQTACCGGMTRPIVCLPIRLQCNVGQQQCAPAKRPPRSAPAPQQRAIEGSDPQAQAAYNNCNFFMSSLANAVCGNAASAQDTECTEESSEYTETSTAAGDDDEWEDDYEPPPKPQKNAAGRGRGGAAAQRSAPPPQYQANTQGQTSANSGAQQASGFSQQCCFPFPFPFPFCSPGGMFGMSGFGGFGGTNGAAGMGMGTTNYGGTGGAAGGDPCAPGGAGQGYGRGRGGYNNGANRGRGRGRPPGSAGRGRGYRPTSGYDQNRPPSGYGQNRAPSRPNYQTSAPRANAQKPRTHFNEAVGAAPKTKSAFTNFPLGASAAKTVQTSCLPSETTLHTKGGKGMYRPYSYSNAELTSRSKIGLSKSAMNLSTIPSHQRSMATSATRSAPDIRSCNPGDPDCVPVYRTTTQTRLQIVERPNEPSEIRVIQRPVQEIVSYQSIGSRTNLDKSRINLNLVTDDTQTENNNNYMFNKGSKKKKNKCYDPCKRKQCPTYHTRRLHRLCSLSNMKKRRLSQIHKPMTCFKAPPCPIRETMASILRKKPPACCRYHEQEAPAFHDYCNTNEACADTNRYPLLTRELSPLCHEYENNKKKGQQGAGRGQEGYMAQHQQYSQMGATGGYSGSAAMQDEACGGSQKVETRGAKRKLHHR